MVNGSSSNPLGAKSFQVALFANDSLLLGTREIREN